MPFSMIVPEFKDPEVTKFMNTLLREVDQRDKERLSSITANKSLLLITPDTTKVYEVTVSNVGVITATKVAG